MVAKPENLYWIEGPWPGRLAIVARPRGGEWLADDVSAWRRTGVDVIVSLLTLGENAELDLSQEADAANKQELQYFSFPIADRNIPASVVATQNLVQQLAGLLSEGKNVGLHCRQGIGRSGLLAASLLVHSGVGVDKAFERIEKARGCPVPDTAEQRHWVEQFGTMEMLPAP